MLKTGIPHFDVFAAAGPLGDALVTAFNLPEASSVATLAILRAQMKSQVRTTVAELQCQGFVSQEELDQQAELWKVLTCIFAVPQFVSVAGRFATMRGIASACAVACPCGGQRLKRPSKCVNMFPIPVHLLSPRAVSSPTCSPMVRCRLRVLRMLVLNTANPSEECRGACRVRPRARAPVT